MWGHEIIDDLNLHGEQYMSIENVNFFKNHIENSIHFYFGEFDGFQKKVIGGTDNEKLPAPFKKELSVEFPYNNMTFFFSHGKYKRAFCVQSLKTQMGHTAKIFNVIKTTKWMAGVVFTTLYNLDKKDWNKLTYSKTKTNNKEFIKNIGLSDTDVDDISVSDYIMINLSVLLLNTKNLIEKNNQAPLKLNRKRKKKGKSPIFDYKTLRIKLPASRNESNGGNGSSDSGTTRLHLCRGHFKYYTKEKPLFGKLTGRYWWQATMRGNIENGAVYKDYEVTT